MMIFNTKCMKFALLLCFVHDVAPYPKPEINHQDANKDAPKEAQKQVSLPNAGKSQQNTKIKNSHKYQREGDAVVGRIEIDDRNIEGRLEVNGDNMYQQDAKIEPGNKDQPNADAVTGIIKMNDRSVEGYIEVSDYINERSVEGYIELGDYINQQDAEIKPGSKDQPNADAITGTIETNDGDIEGHIEIDDDMNQEGAEIKPNNNDQYIGDDIKGSIVINDDDVEGHIVIPDDINNEQNAGVTNGIKNDNTEKSNIQQEEITGKIIMDDESIEEEINLPDQLDGSNNGVTFNKDIKAPKYDIDVTNSGEGQGGDDDTYTGKIEMDDDDNIEGTIYLPDDGGDDQPDLENGNNGQGGDDKAIAGSIEIKDDGGIEGTIVVPDLDNNGQPDAGNNNGGQGGDEEAFTGSVEMNSDGIIGTINLPDGDDNDGNAQNIDAGNDEITGDVAIDDEGNVEGHIDIGNDEENSSGGKDSNNEPKNSPNDAQGLPEDTQSLPKNEASCWMNLNSKRYLDALDEIDAKYSKARRLYQDEIGPDFDKQMMQVLLSSQGKAPRAIHQAHGNPNIIPAGLNIGGFGMMRMPGSILFFHRMKLRNSTVFRVDFLEANMMDMSLVARLSLNDLHLRGSYERATTAEDMASMYFVPTFGELDVLIKTVNYKMEGRLRMLNNRLMIEIVNSNILTREILLSYANSSALARNVETDSIEDFVSRMKCDLDLWLKDYFNDYLMYFGIVGDGKNSEIQLYEKEKTIKANEYADHALRGIKKKIRDIQSANVKLPSFTLLSVNDHRIELKNGILRGLDSLYRRSVAMTKKDTTVRVLDIMIGFSNLKVEYQYVASLVRGMPPLTGLLFLTADELAAHLEISQVDNSQIVDMDVNSIIQLKSESLTVEGPANRLIAEFKHLLENPIIAIMTNVMKHNIKMLKTLTRCEPNLWGDDKEHNPYTNQNDEKLISSYKTGKKIDKIQVFGKDYLGTVEEWNIFSDEENTDSVKLKEKWTDYTFTKNDSVEIEVPVNGKIKKMKLNRNENFVLSKSP